MPPPAIVLCYHAVSRDWRSSMSISPAQLEWQVSSLLRRGYVPATFSDAAVGSPGEPSFAVTFDDAFASVRRLALPILERLGVSATVFATTRFADRGGPVRWHGLEPWADGEHAAELEAMRWDDLADLRRRGWEIGSHTVSHPRLPALGDRELRAELEASRERCERMLGAPCTAIAYPYGDVDARTAAAASAAGYRAGAALGSPPVRAGDPLVVPRIGIGHRDRRWRFAVKSAPAILTLRTLVGR
jgi:peptidoglycan/xylan/chitin deacetylase (PgdA/CDA1 family)